jgi:geranylgeranyl pyrophosphate synthase
MERVAAGGPRSLQVSLAVAVRELSQGASVERDRLFDPSVGLEHARRVNRLKTAALFAYAAEAGAILAEASDDVRDAARGYGLALGHAFQTTDDLLDLCGDPEQLGKPIGQDLLAGEITVPVALAIELDPTLCELVLEVWRSAQNKLDPVSVVVELRRRMSAIGAVAAAAQLAEEDVAVACSELQALPPGPWRDALHHLAQSVLRRQR